MAEKLLTGMQSIIVMVAMVSKLRKYCGKIMVLKYLTQKDYKLVHET